MFEYVWVRVRVYIYIYIYIYKKRFKEGISRSKEGDKGVRE